MSMQPWDAGRPGRSATGGLVMGGVIVAVGLVLLLDNMGILHSYDIWHYWPVVLIAVGLSRFLESRRPAALVWAGVMVLVGALLLVNNLHLFDFSFSMIWPLVIIGFGVSMLLRATDRSRLVGDTRVGSDPNMSFWGIFSGGKRRIDSQDFQSAEVFAIFGGFNIDARDAKIPSGRAIIEANAMFGGVEIIVPETWRVTVNGTAIFGGFEDKSMPPRVVDGTPAPELIVTGSVMFGGVTVRT